MALPSVLCRPSISAVVDPFTEIDYTLGNIIQKQCANLDKSKSGSIQNTISVVWRCLALDILEKTSHEHFNQKCGQQKRFITKSAEAREPSKMDKINLKTGIF